jgi:hypothetical protein
MFYILVSEVENDQEDAILEGEFTDIEIEDYSFQTGTSLSKDKLELPICFIIDEFALRGKMTDHLSIDDIPGPIFSLKTKNLFAKIPITNIEYYQLNILDKFPEIKVGSPKEDDEDKQVTEYTNYFITNVIGLVDCVDHDKSVLEYFYPPELRNLQDEAQDSMNETNNPFADENPNEIDFITKLVLDETKIDPTLKIFRLKDKPDLLVFDESVVNLIRKKKLSGFVFVPVSEYTDVIPDDDKKEEVSNEPEQKKTSVELKQKESSVQLEQKDEPEELSQKEESKEPKKRKLLFD